MISSRSRQIAQTNKIDDETNLKLSKLFLLTLKTVYIHTQENSYLLEDAANYFS
jgi:hypothetical protein